MEERTFKRVENTVEKEKLLVMSNFSFSHNVFKRLVLQTHKNQGLFGKGLKFHVCITLIDILNEFTVSLSATHSFQND